MLCIQCLCRSTVCVIWSFSYTLFNLSPSFCWTSKYMLSRSKGQIKYLVLKAWLTHAIFGAVFGANTVLDTKEMRHISLSCIFSLFSFYPILILAQKIHRKLPQKFHMWFQPKGGSKPKKMPLQFLDLFFFLSARDTVDLLRGRSISPFTKSPTLGFGSKNWRKTATKRAVGKTYQPFTGVSTTDINHLSNVDMSGSG